MLIKLDSVIDSIRVLSHRVSGRTKEPLIVPHDSNTTKNNKSRYDMYKFIPHKVLPYIKNLKNVVKKKSQKQKNLKEKSQHKIKIIRQFTLQIQQFKLSNP